MALSPFRTSAGSHVSISLAPAPALSALNSLALLNAVEEMPALDGWVAATAGALSEDERRANRLVLGILGGALVSAGDWPDFPAYLAALAAEPPERLRERALRHLAHAAALDTITVPEALLADQDAFVARLARHSTADALDTELLREAHALLSDPPRLREALVAHLTAMWERYLADEWQRAFKSLDAEMKGFVYHMRANGETTLDNLRAFAGAELVEAVTAQAGPVEQITFVPSPHNGRYITRLYHDGALWLFFHAPRNFAVLGRQAPIGRKELLLRLEALADETRLRILELFAERDELTAQEIQDALELTQSTASRQLRGLALYIREQRGEGASKRYQLIPAQFDMTFRALKRLVEGIDPDQEDARREAGDLRRFMDRRGRLTMFPTRARDQLLVLEYLAEHFELGRSYTEKEINDIIARHLSYDDFVTIRRELYDHMFLGRERDGSRYWRIDPSERATHHARGA